MEGQQESGPNKVFVGNLSYFATNQDLKLIFQAYGEILETKVCISKDRGPLYYGFVQFQNGEQAKQAVAAVHNTKYLGRRLKVHCQNLQKNQKYQPDNDTDRGVQVLFSFVCTQPTSLLLTEEIFESIFLPYGNIIDCIVKSHVCDTRKVVKPIDASNFVNDSHETINEESSGNEYLRQGGYGFVTFVDLDSAKRLIDTVHLILLPKHKAHSLKQDDFQILTKGSIEEASVLSNQSFIVNHQGKDMVILDLDCKLSRTASIQLNPTSPTITDGVDRHISRSNKITHSNSNENNSNRHPPASQVVSNNVPCNGYSRHYFHHREPHNGPSNVIYGNAHNNIHNMSIANGGYNPSYNSVNLPFTNTQYNGSFPTFPPHTPVIFSPAGSADLSRSPIPHATTYTVPNATTGNFQVLPGVNNAEHNLNQVPFVSNVATNDNNNMSMMNHPSSFPSPIYHPVPTHNVPHHAPMNNHPFHQNITSFSPANSPPPNLVISHAVQNEMYPFPLQPQAQLLQPPQLQLPQQPLLLHNMHSNPPTNSPVFYASAPQQAVYPIYSPFSSTAHPFQSSPIPDSTTNVSYFNPNSR